MEGKTLNEISKELNIDKNVIYRICKKYNIEGTATSKTSNSTKIYSSIQEQEIISHIKPKIKASGKETNKTEEGTKQQSQNQNDDFTKHLEKEIEYLRNQLETKDKQIEELQKQNTSLVRSQAQAVINSQELTKEYIKLKEYSERKLSIKERILGKIALPEEATKTIKEE